VWPFNAHFHVPLLEAARGGALLTGIGGDELLNAATSRRAAAVLSRRVRPVPRDVRRIALHAAPRPLRRAWHAHVLGGIHPWLTPAGRQAARAALAAWEAAEPRGLDARLRHVRAAGYLRVGTQSLALLARAAGAMIGHPLLDGGVWHAVARAAPRGGHLSRTQGMRATFGALLPAELIERSSKASFDELFFGEAGRAFAAGWTGMGVPAGLVDPRALHEHWLAGEPRAQSFSLLQAAWLAEDPSHRDLDLRGVAESRPTLDTGPGTALSERMSE
jgi:asparagine synthase (glutamine-hydrolysing)